MHGTKIKKKMLLNVTTIRVVRAKLLNTIIQNYTVD